MSRLFDSRATVLEYEAKQRLVEKEIELERMRQQRRQWQGLTDEEIDADWRELDGEASALFKRLIRKFARAIEAKLKEKNT